MREDDQAIEVPNNQTRAVSLKRALDHVSQTKSR